MASAVDICNIALANIGEKANLSSISAPYESPNAERCARFYPIARDAALCKGAWTWSTTRVALSSTTPAVESGEYPYAFAMPSDYLRVLAVLPDGATDEINDGLDYIIEGDVLFTTVDVVYLRYTQRITNVNKFNPLFVHAVASLLASYLAGNLTKDPKIAEYWENKFLDVDLPAAAAADANSQRPSRTHTPAWIAAR